MNRAEALINVLIQQRESALTEVAKLAAELSIVQAELAELKKEQEKWKSSRPLSESSSEPS